MGRGIRCGGRTFGAGRGPTPGSYSRRLLDRTAEVCPCPQPRARRGDPPLSRSGEPSTWSALLLAGLAPQGWWPPWGARVLQACVPGGTAATRGTRLGGSGECQLQCPSPRLLARRRGWLSRLQFAGPTTAAPRLVPPGPREESGWASELPWALQGSESVLSSVSPLPLPTGRWLGVTQVLPASGFHM